MPTPLDVATTFSSLEPMAGAVFALTVAYLALPNLRYRDQVNGMAEDALRRLDQLNPSEDKCKTHYGRLVQFCDGRASKSQKSRMERHSENIPDSEDASPYAWLFPLTKAHRISRDAGTSLLFAILCFFVIILGVVETSDAIGLSSLILSCPDWMVSCAFLTMLLAACIPLIFINTGRKWVNWAASQIRNLEKLCHDEIKAVDITAGIPSTPPGSMDDILAAMAEIITRLSDDELSRLRGVNGKTR